jgi:GAF domain-containing protein
MQGMSSTALIPLKTTNAISGVLQIAYRSQYDFTEDDRRLLTTIAEIAGNALQRAAVMETLEQRVADRTRELAALYAVTAVSSEAPDLPTALEQSLAQVLKAMQSSAGAIHLMAESDEDERLTVQQGLQPTAGTPVLSPTLLPRLVDWVITHGDPLVIPPPSAAPGSSWAGIMAVPGAYVGVPMRTHGRALGS